MSDAGESILRGLEQVLRPISFYIDHERLVILVDAKRLGGQIHAIPVSHTLSTVQDDLVFGHRCFTSSFLLMNEAGPRRPFRIMVSD